jgi:hypothetical protein
MFYIASLDNKQVLTYLEYQTVKKSTYSKCHIFYRVQTNIRRSAINKALGIFIYPCYFLKADKTVHMFLSNC